MSHRDPAFGERYTALDGHQYVRRYWQPWRPLHLAACPCWKVVAR